MALAMELTARLECTDLGCWRGGRMLFAGLTLSLESGQAALISGPNGIGKSSLLRVIAGLLPAASGSVSVTGALALANDQTALDANLPLAAALDFWSVIDGGGSVAEALAALSISHLAQVPVRMLSTGQRKRAALARVVAGAADIWLLDEPTNGLDSAAIAQLETIVASHRAKGGIAVIATHQPIDLPDAKQLRL